METITLGIWQSDLRTVSMDFYEDVSAFYREIEAWYLPKSFFWGYYTIKDVEEDEELRDELIPDFLNENWDEAYQFYLDNTKEI